MSDPILLSPQGLFPDVCQSIWGLTVPYKINNGPLVVERRSIEGAFHSRDEIDVAMPDSTFARCVLALDKTWVAYRAFRELQEKAVVREVLLDRLGPEQVLGPTIGNNPVCLSPDGVVAWQDLSGQVNGLRLDTGETLVLRLEIRPTGLSHLDGDHPVFVDDNRLSEPGMLNPVRSGALTVGEGPVSGLRAHLLDKRGDVMGGECFVPRCVDLLNGRYAAVTWGPGRGAFLVLFTADDIQPSQPDPPTEPEPNVPQIDPLPLKLWMAPFWSHGRYGDSDDHVGNAVWTDNPAKYSALGQPLISTKPEGSIDLTVAWWVSGANVDELGQRVREALTWPEKPVIAYLDSDDWPGHKPDWVTPRVWPSVMAYRNKDEPLQGFRGRLGAILSRVHGYGGYLVLTPAFYTRNGTVPVSDITECMPLYELWLRELRICAFMPFADRRPTGMLEHPTFRAWAKAFLQANPGRPNRFDYWQKDSGEVEESLKNKLLQDESLPLMLSRRERDRLIAALGGSHNPPNNPPEPPPSNGEPPNVFPVIERVAQQRPDLLTNFEETAGKFTQAVLAELQRSGNHGWGHVAKTAGEGQFTPPNFQPRNIDGHHVTGFAHDAIFHKPTHWQIDIATAPGWPADMSVKPQWIPIAKEHYRHNNPWMDPVPLTE